MTGSAPSLAAAPPRLGAQAGVGGPGLAAGGLASGAELRRLIPALRGREAVPQAIVVSRPERPEQAEQESRA